MGPKVDPRSQRQKAKIKWVASWMGELDEQGDKIGDWALRVDSSTFKCRWCNKVAIACNVQLDFSYQEGQFNSGGKHSFLKH